MAAAMTPTLRPSWPGTAQEHHEDRSAQEAIGEMAWLLRDTRGSMLLGGGLLSAVAAGLGLEAAFSPGVSRPGLAGVACVVLLAGVIACWIRAVALLLLAGRPLLDQLSDFRWRTGAPVDPRVRWLSVPSAADSEAAWNWTRVNLLLSAARARRERLHLADTWTFVAMAVFVVWTAVLFF